MTEEKEKIRKAILDGVDIKSGLRFFDGPYEYEVVEINTHTEGSWWCKFTDGPHGLVSYTESLIVASVKSKEGEDHE